MSGIFGFRSNKTKAPIADMGFPVGSIFLTVNSANPGTYLGGTWVQIKDRFLLACGDTYNAGATGGASTVKLTAAQSGMPAHSHGFTQPSVALGSHNHSALPDDSYYVTSTAPGSWNVHTNAIAGGELRIDTLKTDDYKFSHAQKTSTVNLGTKTATGGAVQEHAAQGASSAHDNMPPYLAVYVWQRTA